MVHNYWYVIYMCSAVLFVKQRWLLGIFSITRYLHIIDCVTKYAFYEYVFFLMWNIYFGWARTVTDTYLVWKLCSEGAAGHRSMNGLLDDGYEARRFILLLYFLWIFFIIHWISKFQYVSLFCIWHNRGVGWTKNYRQFLFVVEYLTLTNIPF